MQRVGQVYNLFRNTCLLAGKWWPRKSSVNVWPSTGRWSRSRIESRWSCCNWSSSCHLVKERVSTVKFEWQNPKILLLVHEHCEVNLTSHLLFPTLACIRFFKTSRQTRLHCHFVSQGKDCSRKVWAKMIIIMILLLFILLPSSNVLAHFKANPSYNTRRCNLNSSNRLGPDLLRYCWRPESPIFLDHTSLGDTWTLFYLQETSSSGGCLGTQPVTVRLMPQALIFPKGSTLCDQQISADQASLRGTVQLDYLSHDEVLRNMCYYWNIR